MKEDTFKDSSELRYYSVGVVVKGNSSIGSGDTGSVMSSDEILVSPMEVMNAQHQGPITEENCVRAKWLGIGQPHRTTVPNIYPSQAVMLYKYANAEEYYWTTMKFERDLQKAEAVTYAFSNIDPREGWENETKPVSMNSENSYHISVGGTGIFITTPNNRKEKAKYNISINCKGGIVSVEDNKDNKMILDSVKGIVTMDARVRVHVKAKKLITLDAPDTVIKGRLHIKQSAKVTRNLMVGHKLFVEDDLEARKKITGTPIVQKKGNSPPRMDPPDEEKIDKKEKLEMSKATGDDGGLASFLDVMSRLTATGLAPEVEEDYGTGEEEEESEQEEATGYSNPQVPAYSPNVSNQASTTRNVYEVFLAAFPNAAAESQTSALTNTAPNPTNSFDGNSMTAALNALTGGGQAAQTANNSNSSVTTPVNNSTDPIVTGSVNALNNSNTTWGTGEGG